jgi:hypothetical protein
MDNLALRPQRATPNAECRAPNAESRTPKSRGTWAKALSSGLWPLKSRFSLEI